MLLWLGYVIFICLTEQSKEYIDKKGAIETVHFLPGSKLVPVVPADHKMQDQSNQLI